MGRRAAEWMNLQYAKTQNCLLCSTGNTGPVKRNLQSQHENKVKSKIDTNCEAHLCWCFASLSV